MKALFLVGYSEATAEAVPVYRCSFPDDMGTALRDAAGEGRGRAAAL